MATFNIMSAYFHTETDEEVIMIIREQVFELMVKVDTKHYRKYMTINRKVNPLLYVKMHKAFYGFLRSA